MIILLTIFLCATAVAGYVFALTWVAAVFLMCLLLDFLLTLAMMSIWEKIRTRQPTPPWTGSIPHQNNN